MTPKAKQLREMMAATMNLDLHELVEAGVFKTLPSENEGQWKKWNKDAPLVIVKMRDDQLEKLAALIGRKFPAAFAARQEPTQ